MNMNEERIAGIMMGISVGVAIGYYLNPRKAALAGSEAPAEPNLNSGSPSPKILSEVVAVAGAGSARLRRP